MNIIITIPAYNEEQTLPKVVAEIKETMASTRYKYSILVVNDGSKDKTAEVARQAGALVVSHKRNQGLKKTFQTEMKECIRRKADIIVHTDADGQYPAHYIPELITQVEAGADLVLGSRFKRGNSSLPWTKKIGNIAFAKVFSSLLGIPITDSTTGFRAFTREVAESIEFVSSFTYTQEQLIKASKQNFKIKEIAIKSRTTRESRLFKSPLEYAWRAWINILRIYRDYDPLLFFGTIGTSLFSGGILLGLYFTFLHFTTGIQGHVALLVLNMLLLIMGVQIILFGFLADMRR